MYIYIYIHVCKYINTCTNYEVLYKYVYISKIDLYIYIYGGFLSHRGTPTSSIFIGFSIKKYPHVWKSHEIPIYHPSYTHPN